MNIQYVLFGVIVLLFIHFVCYFFNVDIFEIMEKQQPKKETHTKAMLCFFVASERTQSDRNALFGKKKCGKKQ